MKKQEKMTFKKESGFIFALVGSAIGFANILSFSAQCYKNGGGAFLIPFIIAIVIIGLPMLHLEGLIGQKYALPIVSAYGRVLPQRYKAFGWFAALTCLTIGAFYTVLTSWSALYAFFSATNKIPKDTVNFFTREFLRDSQSLAITNGISLPIFGTTLALALLTWYIMTRDISQGVEKVCRFFMPLLFVLFAIFAVIVIFLPGAGIGFYHYLHPDWSKLLDFRLWRDVFGHVFFSFSLGIGIIVAYSRHTKKETNIRRAMIYVALGDIIFSAVAGFAIFGCVGFMSHQTGTPFHEIVTSDSTFQMGFIIFPQIIQLFSSWLQPIVGLIFFFCVFIAGITGVFSIVESVAGNIEVEFATSRKASMSITIIIMLAMSSFFCMGNGVHILAALQPMVLGNAFLIGGIAQIYTFMIVEKNIQHDALWYQSNNKPRLSYYCVKYIGFAFLALNLIGSLYEEAAGEPWSMAHTVRWVWFAMVVIAAVIAAQKREAAAQDKLQES